MRGRKPTVKITADDQATAAPPPNCPRHLDAEARKEWRRVTKQMRDAGTLDGRDRALLAVYCQAWSRLVHAETEMAKTGPLVTVRRAQPVADQQAAPSMPVQSPWLPVINRAVEQLQRIAGELGLSPISRTRIKASKPKAKTESKWGDDLADNTTVRLSNAV